MRIYLSQIDPPRELLRLVDKDSVEFMELKESLKANGVLQPVVVRPLKDRYQIIDGLHRFTAARDLGWDEIDASIISASDERALILTLECNAVRKETLPIEYAQFLKKILKVRPETDVSSLSRMIHKSPSWICQQLSLCDLPKVIQAAVDRGAVPLNSAYLLARLPNHERERLFLLSKALPFSEFKQHAARAIKAWKESIRLARVEQYYPDDFVPPPRLRPISHIEEELKTFAAAADFLSREDLTPLEAWTLALKWVMRVDEGSLELRTLQYQSKRRIATPEPEDESHVNCNDPEE